MQCQQHRRAMLNSNSVWKAVAQDFQNNQDSETRTWSGTSSLVKWNVEFPKWAELTLVHAVLSGSPRSSGSCSDLCWSSCAWAGWNEPVKTCIYWGNHLTVFLGRWFMFKLRTSIDITNFQKHGPWSWSSSQKHNLTVFSSDVTFQLLTCSQPSGWRVCARCRTGHPASGKHSLSRCRNVQRVLQEQVSGGSVCLRSEE